MEPLSSGDSRLCEVDKADHRRWLTRTSPAQLEAKVPLVLYQLKEQAKGGFSKEPEFITALEDCHQECVFHRTIGISQDDEVKVRERI